MDFNERGESNLRSIFYGTSDKPLKVLILSKVDCISPDFQTVPMWFRNNELRQFANVKLVGFDTPGHPTIEDEENKPHYVILPWYEIEGPSDAISMIKKIMTVVVSEVLQLEHEHYQDFHQCHS